MRLGFPDNCSSNDDADVVCGVARNMDQNAHDTEVAVFASSGLIRRFMTVIAVQGCTLFSLIPGSASFPFQRVRRATCCCTIRYGKLQTRALRDASSFLRIMIVPWDNSAGDPQSRWPVRGIPWRMAALMTFKTKPTHPMIMTRRGFSTADEHVRGCKTQICDARSYAGG